MQQTLIQKILAKGVADSGFIDNQNLIAKLSLLELLQKYEKYLCLDSTYSTTYYKRIETSLHFIPDKYQHVALTLFANVFYVGEGLLSDALVYLFKEVLSKYENDYEKVVKSMHIFETDPSGLIEAFFRVNHIEGRLDAATFSRCKSVGEFITSLNNFNTCESLRQNTALQTSIKALLDKKIWILLTDFSFSGTSIKSDIERMIKLRDICYDPNDKPQIIVCAQIISSKALRAIEAKFSAQGVSVFYAQLYNDQLRIVPEEVWKVEGESELPSTLLFEKDQEVYKQVLELCNWFASKYIDKDPAHDYTRDKCDRKTMAYGFQDCGYTVIPQRNSPSNSLPIFWYKPSKEFIAKYGINYIPPFPRTISRVTQSKSGDGDHLKSIEDNKEQLQTLLKALMYPPKVPV